MKIFIINLKRSVNRRARMERILNDLKLNFEFIQAVDGHELPDQEIKRFVDHGHQYHRPFMPGEIGCFLSHYGIYQRIVAEKLPYALILEDDVILSVRLPMVLEQLKPLIEQGDVISLYSSFPGPCRLYKEKEIDQNYAIIRPVEGQLVLGAVAYIITQDTAQEMVRHLLPMTDVIDDWRHWIKMELVKKFKIVFPHPVDISDLYSDINESYGSVGLNIKKIIVNKQLPFLASIILIRRKMKRWKIRKKNIIIDDQKPDALFY